MVPAARMAFVNTTTTARGLLATDKLVIGFAAAFAIIVMLHAGQSPAWPWQLAAMALLALLAVLASRAPADSPFMRFVGPAYPMIVMPALYGALGTLNEDIGRNHDVWAQHLERAVFGSAVSVTWHQVWPNALLSSVLHLCYVSYYPIVATVVLWHFWKTPRAAFERAVFITVLAAFTCYLAFALWPVDGPRYFYGAATGAAAEVAPARLVHALLAGGSSRGTAFPSSHICICGCAVLATWASSRRLTVALGIPAFGLALATVYGQFHYAVDAVAGAVLAWLVLLAADPLLRRLSPPAPPAPLARRATEAFRLR